MSDVEKISFPLPSEKLPGFILEQCVQIRALLATHLNIQIELLAHFTQADPEVVRASQYEALASFVIEFAREAETSNILQPPSETP